MEGVSPFNYTELNTDNTLYVGGVPRTLSDYSLFKTPERVSIERGGREREGGEGGEERRGGRGEGGGGRRTGGEQHR